MKQRRYRLSESAHEKLGKMTIACGHNHPAQMLRIIIDAAYKKQKKIKREGHDISIMENLDYASTDYHSFTLSTEHYERVMLLQKIWGWKDYSDAVEIAIIYYYEHIFKELRDAGK